MNIKKLSEEEIEKMSMVDLANLFLIEDEKEYKFLDLFNEIAEIKGLSASAKEDKLGQFYTDINIDGRFTALGSNNWGLKRWYPMSQTSEKQITDSRKRDLEDLEDEEFFEEDEEYKELGLEDEDKTDEIDEEELEEDAQ